MDYLADVVYENLNTETQRHRVFIFRESQIINSLCLCVLL